MPTSASDLWSLVQGNPWIDPRDLLAAIEQQALEPDPDFRTRLLIRDSYQALAGFWGVARAESALSPAAKAMLASIEREPLGATGFPSLKSRVMDTLHRETILEFFRDLGNHLTQKCTLHVGGASALILHGCLRRATEDIDVVDELPAAVRIEHGLLAELITRFVLHLTRFRSRYLPTDWISRVRSLDRFGSVDVLLVDVHDIFLGKLFSNRSKDLDDLRILKRSLRKERLVDLLNQACGTLAGDPKLRESADRNWHVLYGEALPYSKSSRG